MIDFRNHLVSNQVVRYKVDASFFIPGRTPEGFDLRLIDSQCFTFLSKTKELRLATSN